MVVLKEVGFSADHANKCMKVLERDKHAHTRSRRWGASEEFDRRCARRGISNKQHVAELELHGCCWCQGRH